MKNVCGETIVKRLSNTNKLYYPTINPDGDFEVQGKTYSMKEYVSGGDEYEV